MQRAIDRGRGEGGGEGGGGREEDEEDEAESGSAASRAVQPSCAARGRTTRNACKHFRAPLFLLINIGQCLARAEQYRRQTTKRN